MRQWGNRFREKGMLLLLAGILCVYFGAICLINVSGRPSFYCTDMYADMLFAAKAWEQKSLVPEGWLFGNQLYVVATPALAALYCGIVSNPQIAMALAAVTMTILILVSFLWMLKGVFSFEGDKLLCMVLFLAFGLYFGDSVGTVNGWQLFFTMCAYYGCYLLNVLLAFGCYLRADGNAGRSFRAVLAFTCILSFGTGMQSLRQTAVMSVPLMAMGFMQLLTDLRKKENWKRPSFFTAVLISGMNGAGLLFQKTVEFEQTEIFGQLGLVKPSQVVPSVGESFGTMLELLHCETGASVVLRFVILVLSGFAAAELYLRKRRGEDGKAFSLGTLLLLSVLAIFAIDVVTTLEVRSIYYFMFYLLTAFLCAYGFSKRRELLRWLFLTAMILVLILPGMLALKDICMQAYFAKYDPIYGVSDYLLEEGYDTVYAAWNMGEEIAVASEFQIKAGFWDEGIFVPVTYLCDPVVYTADADSCAYVLFGEESAVLAEQAAEAKGVMMSLVRYFPDSNAYIYTASENLMQKVSE